MFTIGKSIGTEREISDCQGLGEGQVRYDFEWVQGFFWG